MLPLNVLAADQLRNKFFETLVVTGYRLLVAFNKTNTLQYQ
jgi:hypothetical protein